MNIKQIIAATLLLAPIAATSLLTKPASADEVYTRQSNYQVVVSEPRHNYYRHRRVWIPGYWKCNHYGQWYWVPGHYEYRRYERFERFYR